METHDTRETASARAAGSFEPLLELATPQLYRQIAFRLLELPVHAGERELERRRELMEKAARSQLPVPAGTGRLLPLPQAADEHALRAAAHALQDAQRRLAHEFFWFWPLPPNAATADPALRHLATGDAAAALAIWRRTEGAARPVARHNLAVWHHLKAVDRELDELSGVAAASTANAAGAAPASNGTAAAAATDADNAWRAANGHWRELLRDESLWAELRERIRRIADASLDAAAAAQLRATLPVVLSLIMARLAIRALDAGREMQARRLARQIPDAGFAHEAVSEGLRLAIEPARALCRTLRQEAQDRGLADNVHADVAAEQLLDRAAAPLALLDLLLPPTHPAREAERDEVADVALTCANRFANAGGDPRRSLALIDRLAPLACGAAVQDRIRFNREANVDKLQELFCWGCGENEGDEKLALEVKLFGDVRNEPIPGGTRTTWRHGTFTVPRCRQCADEEQLAAGSGAMAVLILNVGLVAGVIAFQYSEVAGVTTGAVGALLSIWHAMRDRRARVRKSRPGITRRARNDFPAIKQRLGEGWQFGERPLGT